MGLGDPLCTLIHVQRAGYTEECIQSGHWRAIALWPPLLAGGGMILCATTSAHTSKQGLARSTASSTLRPRPPICGAACRWLVRRHWRSGRATRYPAIAKALLSAPEVA